MTVGVEHILVLSLSDMKAAAMTRPIPPTLAGVLELLELERPVTVTTERLAERGWLLKTGVRGVWENGPPSMPGRSRTATAG